MALSLAAAITFGEVGDAHALCEPSDSAAPIDQAPPAVEMSAPVEGVVAGAVVPAAEPTAGETAFDHSDGDTGLSSTTDEVARAQLEIDTSALGSDGTIIAERIKVRAEALLRAHEVLPARDAKDPHILIQVLPLEGGEPGYRCSWSITRGSSAIEGSEGASLCRLCTEDELVEHVEAAIDRLVPSIPIEPSPVAAAVDARPGQEPVPVPVPLRHRAKLGAMGWTGAAAAALGSASLIAGAVLAAKKPQETLGPDRSVTDTRLPGAVLTGVGLAGVAAGIFLLVVDVGRVRRHNRGRAMSVTTYGGTGAGATVSGRF